MRYYRFDLRNLLQIQLLGSEHLIPPRMHITRRNSEYILYVMTEGVMKLEVNGELRRFVPGDVVLFDKNDFQKPVESTNCRYFYVHFLTDGVTVLDLEEDAYGAVLEEKKRKCLTVNIHSLEAYDHLTVCVGEKYSIADHTAFSYIVKTLSNHCLDYCSKFPQNRLAISRAVEDIFLRLESLTITESDKSNQLASDIAAYVEKNYTTDFDGKVLSQVFYRNFDYLNRVFGKTIGCSIMHYRNQIRLNEAKMKLLTTELPVGEIGNQVGFHNPYYFSRLFKEWEGLTPTEYRAQKQR